MANKPMKTLTIGTNTYEVIDAASRYAISALETILGDVNDLRTADKSSLINSINEIADQVSNLSYGGGDAEAGAIIKTLEEAIGDLSNLQTDDTSSLVAAINELKAELADIPSGGVLDSEIIETIEALEQTTENITNDIGDIGELKTTDKSSVVAAINELSTKTPAASNGEDAEARAAIEELAETIEGIGDSVNELNTSVGTLSSLQTTNKTSLVDAINELSTKSPAQSNGEDTEAREAIEELNDAFDGLEQNVDTLVSSVGTLSSLQTTNKTNLVSAINELANRTPSSGTTGGTVDSDARASIEQLSAAVGNLSSLQTEDKTAIVAAINELVAKINSFTGSDISKEELDEAFGEVWEALRTVANVIGTPENLETNAKNLVEAINEVLNKIPAEVGDGVDAEARASIEALNETVSTLDDNIKSVNASLTNVSNSLGRLNQLQTTDKASIVAAINELANRPTGGGEGGSSAPSSVSWEDIQNKPFGDVTPIIWEVDPNAEKVDVEGAPMVRVADVPESVDIFCYGTLITTTGESIPIYPEIISDFTSTPMPDGYAFVIDYSALLSVPGLYMIINTDDSLAVMICMQDVNSTDIGLTASAGLYANATNIAQIQGAKITKIPSVFLPPMDDGAGAYVVDLTTMVDTNDAPIVLSNESSFTTRDTFAQGLVAAAQKGKPVMIITKADVTGEKRLYLTGSVLIDDATGYMSLSGVFANMADAEALITQVYKYHLVFVNYLGYGSVVMSIITDISEGLISPAANIKYIDFGSNEPDMSGIDFSTYNTGDLILALVDVP